MFNITPTTELQALKELDLMDSNATMGLNALKHYAGQSFNSFWYGSISPSIKVQLLGNKALSVFQASALTQQFIKTLDPTWEELTVPVGFNVLFNEDGSATITEGNQVVEEEVVPDPVIEEPVVEEVIEEVVDPIIEEPVVDEPVIEEVIDEPIIEEPIIEPPVVISLEESTTVVVEEPIINIESSSTVVSLNESTTVFVEEEITP